MSTLRWLPLAGALLFAIPPSQADHPGDFYATSVRPSLPSPDHARALLRAPPVGLLGPLRRAQQDAKARGWLGIPSIDRRPSPNDAPKAGADG